MQIHKEYADWIMNQKDRLEDGMIKIILKPLKRKETYWCNLKYIDEQNIFCQCADDRFQDLITIDINLKIFTQCLYQLLSRPDLKELIFDMSKKNFSVTYKYTYKIKLP